MDYKLNSQARWVDESFEIKVRNHKSTPAEMRIVEHLYRWKYVGHQQKLGLLQESRRAGCTVRGASAPDGEEVLTYQINYSW